ALGRRTVTDAPAPPARSLRDSGGLIMDTKMVQRGRLAVVVLGAFALVCVAGCGGERRVRVAGTVTLDDKPFTGGCLQFTPDAAKGNTRRIVCFAPIKDGRYNLETSGISRDDSGAGVPLGWYKVTFMQMEESTRKVHREPVHVHPKFMNPDKT